MNSVYVPNFVFAFVSGNITNKPLSPVKAPNPGHNKHLEIARGS